MATPYSFHVSLVEFPHTVPGAIDEKFNVDEKTYFELRNANRGSWGLIPMLLCVIRTDTLNNFTDDLFCPTFFHIALKANEFAGRVFGGMICLFLDALTLPLRMITLLPRVIISLLYTKENHPGYRFLMNRSANPEVYRKVNMIYATGIEPLQNGRTKISTEQYFFTPVPKATLKEYRLDPCVLF